MLQENVGDRELSAQSRAAWWSRVRPGVGIAALATAMCGFVAVVPASAGPLSVSLGLVGVLVGARRSRRD